MSQTNTKATKATKAASNGNRQDVYDCLEPWDDTVVSWRKLHIGPMSAFEVGAKSVRFGGTAGLSPLRSFNRTYVIVEADGSFGEVRRSIAGHLNVGFGPEMPAFDCF